MQETRVCQNCQKEFTIEPEDFTFYKKIKVPAPTWCPECRMIRRMNWRNERSLYKRKCGLTGKNIVSCFSEDSGITVYNNKDWFSDKWNPMDYGRNYDFNKPFFKQFRELLTKVPMPATFIDAQSVNSEYCNHAESMKNCYLSFGALDDEEVNYCDKVSASKEVYDSLVAAKSELAYQLISADKI